MFVFSGVSRGQGVTARVPRRVAVLYSGTSLPQPYTSLPPEPHQQVLLHSRVFDFLRL